MQTAETRSDLSSFQFNQSICYWEQIQKKKILAIVLDKPILTDLCLVDSSTSLFRQVHFKFKGCLICFQY